MGSFVPESAATTRVTLMFQTEVGVDMSQNCSQSISMWRTDHFETLNSNSFAYGSN